jgi:hypothetical protein
MSSSSNADGSTSNSPTSISPSGSVDNMPSLPFSKSDASSKYTEIVGRSHEDSVSSKRHSNSGDANNTASIRPSLDFTERRKTSDGEDGKPVDWTGKLRKAQMKIETVCPFCRHVICSQKCQDKQRLRYAWDAWVDAVDPPADICSGSPLSIFIHDSVPSEPNTNRTLLVRLTRA